MPRNTRSRGRRSGFGTVEALPSGKYRARWRTPDGQRHTAPHTFTTRGDARAYLTQVHAKILAGDARTLTPSRVLLADYIADYLRDSTTTLRPRTLDLYQRTAATWLLSPVGITTRTHIAALQLSALTPALIRQWHTGLLESTRANALRTTTGRRTHPARIWANTNGITTPRTGRLPAAVLDAWTAAGSPEPDPAPADPNAGRTAAAGAYRLLRTILGQAVTDGLIPTNPAHVKGASTAPHPERRPLTPAEVATLADAMPTRYRAAVITAAWSGLRPGEVFALRRSDFDPTAGTLTITRAQVEVPGQPITYGPPKSAAGRRTVHLPRFVTDALTDHLRIRPADDAALIFTTGTGRPVSASARSTAMRTARQHIDRTDVTWHHLRHTGATLAAQAGATQAELQARIGHSTTRAAALYQHAASDRDRALAERLNTLATTPDPTPPTPPTTPSNTPATPKTPPGITYTTRRGHLAALA